MPGVFSKANRPLRPGAYFNFEAVAQSAVLASLGQVVALPITHNWGPFEVTRRVDSLADFKAVYGASEGTPGFKAVKQAFQGEGLPGRGGAGAVVVYRAGSSAAAKATRVLNNTTPAAAVTLTARYEGSKGNDLRVTVQDVASDTSKTEVILYDGTVELERYRFPDTDIADLVAQVNGTGNYTQVGASDWVTATQSITGVALAVITSQPFTTGDDGSTLIAGDWTAALAAIETERFSVFAPYDLTDTAILASLKTWAVNLNNNGKRFMSVIGGAAAETAADAADATGGSTQFADPNFMRVGIGTVTDDSFGDLSTSQLAPRIAGILAALGERRSATFARLAGLSLKIGATESDIASAFDNGVTALSRDSHPDAPVRIEKGLTTYILKTNTAVPYAIYRNPKFVRTMGGIQMELSEWADHNVIGQLPVSDKTRDHILAETSERLAARERDGVIQPGWSVAIDTDPPATPGDEFIGVVIGLTFGRSTEQVFFTARVA